MEKEAEVRIREAIVEAEAAAKRAREWADKARRAGIDVSEQERRLADLEAKTKRMRTVYIEGK